MANRKRSTGDRSDDLSDERSPKRVPSLGRLISVLAKEKKEIKSLQTKVKILEEATRRYKEELKKVRDKLGQERDSAGRMSQLLQAQAADVPRVTIMGTKLSVPEAAEMIDALIPSVLQQEEEHKKQLADKEAESQRLRLQLQHAQTRANADTGRLNSDLQTLRQVQQRSSQRHKQELAELRHLLAKEVEEKKKAEARLEQVTEMVNQMGS